MNLLLQAGADPNVRDDYSTAFKIAGKKKMRLMDGMFQSYSTCSLCSSIIDISFSWFTTGIELGEGALKDAGYFSHQIQT